MPGQAAASGRRPWSQAAPRLGALSLALCLAAGTPAVEAWCGRAGVLVALALQGQHRVRLSPLTTGNPLSGHVPDSLVCVGVLERTTFA